MSCCLFRMVEKGKRGEPDKELCQGA
eukprot:COSAG06_NODE_49194_length_327_cov_0.679825_1_plen_25_part_10